MHLEQGVQVVVTILTAPSVWSAGLLVRRRKFTVWLEIKAGKYWPRLSRIGSRRVDRDRIRLLARLEDIDHAPAGAFPAAAGVVGVLAMVVFDLLGDVHGQGLRLGIERPGFFLFAVEGHAGLLAQVQVGFELHARRFHFRRAGQGHGNKVRAFGGLPVGFAFF